MYAEALRRGLAPAKEVIALTDGALYHRPIVQTHFPDAVHIVDLFHAYEHLTAIAQILWGQQAKAPKAWRDLLEAGDIGRLVGSGVIEAGCRTVIGKRLKQSGMRWSVRGANAIIALRCCILSGRFEDFWASRTS